MKHSFFVNRNIKFLLAGTIAVVGTAIWLTSKMLTTDQANDDKSLATKQQNPKKKEKSKIPKSIIDPNKKYIYLTFDDGPNKGTQNLIRLIKKENIKVTAFLVGQHVYSSNRQKADFQELKNNYLFELANHSYTHALNNNYAKFYKSPDIVINDFNRSRDSLHLSSPIARTPGRNIWRIGDVNFTDLKNSKLAADNLSENKYQLMGWDVEWKGNKHFQLMESNAEMIDKVDSLLNNNLTKSKNHLVLLTHDQYLRDSASVKRLADFIETIKTRKDYEFRQVSEYPELIKALN